MVVARVRRGLEAEAPLDLQAGVAGEVADIPESVWLALKQGDDDGAAGREREQRAPEEVDEELLVVADLAVDVGALAADMGEVEYWLLYQHGKEEGKGRVHIHILSKMPIDSFPDLLAQGPIFFASTP